MMYVMNSIRPNQAALTQEQIDHLTSSHFINRIDDHLKIVSSIEVASTADDPLLRVTLQLEIYYNNLRFDSLSFNLHDYKYEEILHLAKNIRDNEFILQEVDIFLAGDVGE